MSRRAALLLAIGFLGWPLAPAAAAGPERSVVTTDNADYFGFDLRAEQNLSLQACRRPASAIPAAAPSPTTPRRAGASSNRTTTS